jgi:ribose transport system permease protein
LVEGQSQTVKSIVSPEGLSQEKIVFLIALLLFVTFTVFLPGFMDAGNLISLVRNVSILGILGLGMALAIIGRGIDLSMVATMAITVAWILNLVTNGTPIGIAILYGLIFSLAVGLINGILIAYVEIPAIFATLAMGTVVYGFGRAALIESDVVYLPDVPQWFQEIGGGQTFSVPNPVFLLVLFCAIIFLLLKYTRPGRYLFGIGDNPMSARIAGIPVRPTMVLQYLATSLIGFAAGVIMATSVDVMNTRIATSTMVYDVILVVVIGGVGLSGGKGGVRNVIVGTLLIGILLNGMTIMDIPYTVQNIIKSLILLAAIIADSLVNPRDEQTSQQGDI